MNKEQKPVRHGLPWTKDEESELQHKYSQGMPISQLSAQHCRTPLSVRAKLVRKGSVDPYIPSHLQYLAEQYEPFDMVINQERNEYPWTDVEIRFLIESIEENSACLLDTLANVHRRHQITIAYWLAKLRIRSDPNVAYEKSTDSEEEESEEEQKELDEFERTEHGLYDQICESHYCHPGLSSYKDYMRKLVNEDVGNNEISSDEIQHYEATCEDAEIADIADDLDGGDYERIMGGPDDNYYDPPEPADEGYSIWIDETDQDDSMNNLLAKLGTPLKCERFEKDALERKREDLACVARRRAVVLRAEAYGTCTNAERECLKAIYAYEIVLAAKNGRRIRATGVWKSINKYGIIQTAERIVNRGKETVSYAALLGMGLQRYTFEAVVLHYPEQFSGGTTNRAKWSMKQWPKPADPIV